MSSAVSATRPQAPIQALLKALQRVVPGQSTPLERGPGYEGWRLYTLHPATGQIGPELDPVSGSWEILLNATETMTMTVRKASLGGLRYSWFYPRIGGLLLTWTEDGIETPWIAGPITSWGEETATSWTFEGAGFRALYEYLIVGTDLNVKDVSLGEIAWQLVQQQELKPGGPLPVFDASPDRGGRGHRRYYAAWNAANNTVDKLLKELSEVEDGPDVMFRPEFAYDRRFITWGLVHGTSRSARLPAKGMRSFDTTAPEGGIRDVKVVTDSSAVVSRVWVTGSGEGEGTRIARAESTELLQAGYPFGEVVISDPGATVDPAKTEKIEKAKVTKRKVTKRKVTRNAVTKTFVPAPKLTASMSAAQRKAAQDKYARDKANALTAYNAAKAAADTKYKNEQAAAERDYKADQAAANAEYEAGKKKADADYEAAKAASQKVAEELSREEELKLLTARAVGEMNARVDAVDQISVTTRADDEQHGISRFFVGDPAAVTVRGWFSVPDGTHNTLIVKAAGGLDRNVTIDFQTGTWV